MFRRLLDDPSEMSVLLTELLLASDLLGLSPEGSDGVYALLGRLLTQPDLSCCIVSSITEGVWTTFTEQVRLEENATSKNSVSCCKNKCYCEISLYNVRFSASFCAS